MYKVFVNEKPLTFSETPLEGVKNVKYDNETTFNVAIDKLQNSSIPAINIFYHNLTKLWSKFTHHFFYLEAAGGIVENKKDEILFIQRFQKWDLPKGKVEEGESLETTAEREIGEECGVHELEMRSFIMTTYHIYQVREPILKATHWYLLFSTQDNPTLIPQKEEGIEKVEWIPRENLDLVYENTYENIRLLLNTYLKKKRDFLLN